MGGFFIEAIMKEGKALQHSPQIEKWYNKELQKLCKEMFGKTFSVIESDFKKLFANKMSATELTSHLNALFETYYELFKKRGKIIAKKFLEKQIRQARISTKQALEPIANKDLGFMQKGSVVNDNNKNIVKMEIYNNVSLIASIPQQYFTDVAGEVTRTIAFGGGFVALVAFLTRYKKITEKRAKLISYDQTRKVYSAIALQEMKDAGFNKVKWRHSNAGKEPREYHLRKWDGVSGKEDGHPNGLNGFIYEIDNPPVIEEAYEPKTERGTYRPEVRGHPAQLINCRCFLVPVVE